MKKICYIADIGDDIDDLIAIEYLKNKKADFYVAIDRKSNEDPKRVQLVRDWGVQIENKIMPGTEVIFIGGAFTKVRDYLKTNKVSLIVANGGFIGNNIISNPLPKFRNKKEVRTFNFNVDIDATIEVLDSKNFEKMYLVGKQVCHDKINTTQGIWKASPYIKTSFSPTKLLHDVLAVDEGLRIMEAEDTRCNYIGVTPYWVGSKDKFAMWGSRFDDGSNILGSISFK